jgi:cytochrome c-type biogenesis protein CcmE
MENQDTTTGVVGGVRMKFLIGGALIIAAVIYLIFSATQANSQYFWTIEELEERGSEAVGQSARVSGAVVGDLIDYDAQNLQLDFTVVHIPGDNDEIEEQGGIAEVLHQAVNNSENLPSLRVHYEGVMPDLMKNEAQAIMTGKMGDDGIFYADELLLKCPTRYEEEIPDQAEG